MSNLKMSEIEIQKIEEEMRDTHFVGLLEGKSVEDLGTKIIIAQLDWTDLMPEADKEGGTYTGDIRDINSISYDDYINIGDMYCVKAD